MSNETALKTTLNAIEAAGTDTHWDAALAAIAHLLGAEFATLETFDRRTRSHLAFRASSLPPGSMTAYLDHYSPLCPRTDYIWQRPGEHVVYDHLVMDETAMDHHPYYQEFLNMEGLQYFMSGLVERTSGEQTLVTVQRSEKAGHVSSDDVQAIRGLLPTLRNSLDLSNRLPSLGASLRGTLDWLSDGAAVISRQEKLIYANPALEVVLSAGDGIRLGGGMLDLADSKAAAALGVAIAAIQRQRIDPMSPLHMADILVARPSGARPYLLSVRALPGTATDTLFIAADPVAIIFVRDAARQIAAMPESIRKALGLTPAEARFAMGLRQGITPHEYAATEGLSQHTVYTYLRRLREKLGVSNAGALVSLLADIDPPYNGA